MAATNETIDHANGTTSSEIIEFFESSFADKHELPDSLVLVWLKRAIARYSLEVEELVFDEEKQMFSKQLHSSVIETLCLYMKKFYQERQLSKTNKRISIVGKEVSINSGMSSSKYVESELLLIDDDLNRMISDQIPSAYN